MKKTMSKNKKRTEGANRQNLEVDKEAVKIQRTVRDDEAFYFYEAVGKPTGEIARNLSDFLDKVKSVKSESLMFHHLRGDFPNWIERILGDSKLAGKLERITPSNGDDVRMKISKTVENRLKELGESSPAILVDENLAVLQPSS
jgi:hypothetical protein